jgi:peptidyl-prolyl cis-trans isomerase SurA
MPDPRLKSHGTRWRLFVIWSALAAACFTAACRSTPATPEKTVSADTWAVVDGREITREAVDRAYRRAQDASQALSDEETLTAKLNLLNDLIIQEILLGKAGQLKLEVAQSELDAAYANAGKNITADAFQAELTRRGLSPADLREGLRRELLMQKVIDQEVGSKIAVTDQEVSDFFNANRAQFNVAEESYRLAQIVVTPTPDPQVANGTGDDASTPQAAAAKVQMLMERLKAGASFRDLAMGYSEDPESAPRGGDLGLVPVSRLKQAPPQLRDAVLNKEPGAVNVASDGGAYTMVLVVGREPAGQRDLSMPAVREGITRTLRTRKEQLLRAAYLTAVRTDAVVVNYLARRLVEGKGTMPSIQPAAPTGSRN